MSVGGPRPVERGGQINHTAIYKTAIEGPVRATGVNLEGDDQADRRVHGGRHKAIYAYADEDRQWWESQTGRDIEPAAFGENLTTIGIDVTNSVIGEQWAIGGVVLEVSEPRLACWKLNHRMDDAGFIKRFTAAGRPGAYLRIVSEGFLEAGDCVRVVHVPDHGVTVRDVARINRHRAGAELLLSLDLISDTWKVWAAQTLSRGTAGEAPASRRT